MARIATGVARRTQVRSSPVGWSMATFGGQWRLCRTLPDLIDVWQPDLESAIRQAGTDALYTQILQLGRHRRLEIEGTSTWVPDIPMPIPTGVDPEVVLIPRLFYAAAITQSTIGKGSENTCTSESYSSPEQASASDGLPRWRSPSTVTTSS
ncbi:MAG: hypothetical protein ACK5LN_09825 [Propioniciclava sp.]